MSPAVLLLLEPPTDWGAWFQAHPHLPGLLFAITCLLLLLIVGLPRLQSWKRGRHRPVLSPTQLEELLLGPGALVLDLRGPAPFKLGHIRGSLNLTWAEFETRFRTPDPKARRALVLVDETDEISHHAYDLLLSRRFEWIYVLKGGMRAWRRQGLPLAKI